MYISALSADLPFEEAATLFMQLCKIEQLPGAVHTAQYVRNNTLISYQRNIDSLDLFFHGMKLNDIHEGNLRGYQVARVNGAEPFIRFRRPQDKKDRIVGDKVIPAKGKTPCPVKPEQANQELSTLGRIMRMAQAWTPELALFWKYRKLTEESSETPRALTPEEQTLWLEVSRSQERWGIIHWYSIVAFHTTCSTNELRALRIGDVNLHHQMISVPWAGAKCKSRHRSIAIETADCLWALEQLLERAKDLGSVHPQHYLFPFFNPKKQSHVPERPMTVSGLKRRWEEVRKATRLTWFRIYDTRHTAITRLAETGAPIALIKSKAGHTSDRMSRHYTHVSIGAQRRWYQSTIPFQPQPQTGWYPPAQIPPSAQPNHPRVVTIFGRKVVNGVVI